jgi:hypothetical protein
LVVPFNSRIDMDRDDVVVFVLFLTAMLVYIVDVTLVTWAYMTYLNSIQ